jgi:type IV pilus assembly protein PilP
VSLRPAYLLATGFAVALLAGCGNDGMDELQAYVAEVKTRPPAHIEPIPQIRQFDAYVYLPIDRRDPFMPVEVRNLQQPANSGLHPNTNRNREPLEEFPVDSLRMLGMVTFQEKRYALLKAPDGIVHRVGLGDHVGQNYGQVVQITESEIALKEIVQDGFGGWVERPAKLALQEN